MLEPERLFWIWCLICLFIGGGILNLVQAKKKGRGK
jgi:hypothetical protein